jgi:hypothetical protein
MNSIPIEDEYVFWITKQIIEFFERIGFTVTPIGISRRREHTAGYDWRYELQQLNKMFALQFKRPMNTQSIQWELEQHQHNLMKNKKWIFYCLPKSKDRNEMSVMLYRCVFKRASFPFVRCLSSSQLRYCDGWGSFASKVIRCVYGVRLNRSEEDYYRKIEIDFEQPVVVFGLSTTKKEMKIFVYKKLFEKFEFKFEKII